MMAGMKSEKPQTPDDIELVPDAWERFKRAVKIVAQHPPVEHPTGYGKAAKQKRRATTRRKAK
jgi:hypothetical protein